MHHYPNYDRINMYEHKNSSNYHYYNDIDYD